MCGHVHAAYELSKFQLHVYGIIQYGLKHLASPQYGPNLLIYFEIVC